MANTYGAHWRILFTSLRTGTHYNLDVYSKNYSGSVVYLKGADQPFVTEEQDDEDVFTPVRTQTGYLRILDNGLDKAGNAFNWRDLMPADALDRPVKLWHTENNQTIIDWLGYLQPQNFSSDYAPGVQKREFPVCCRLSALKGIDVQPTNTEYSLFNFAYIIEYVIDKSSIFSVTDYYHLNFSGGSEALNWLKTQIAWQNFADTDEDGNINAKYNCFQLLEEVCKVFGWTCRVKGDTFYFEANTDNDMQDWLSMNSQDLEDIATGHEDKSEVVPRITLQSLPSDFESTDNKLFVVRGWHKSSVVAKIDKIDAIIEYPYDEINEKFRSNTITRTETRPGSGLWKFTKKDLSPARVTYNFKHVTMEFYEGTRPEDAPGYGPINYYAAIHVYNYEQEENPHTINFRNALVVLHSVDNDRPLLKIKTKLPYTFSDGAFIVSARTYHNKITRDYNTNKDTFTPTDAHGRLLCTLKVGNTMVGGGIIIPKTNGSEGKFKDDKIWNDGLPDFSGTKFPVNGVVGGHCEFDIYEYIDGEIDHPISENQMNECNILDLKFEFIKNDAATLQKNNSENKYVTSTSSSPFAEEKSIDLAFFTDDHNAFATNVIFNEDGTYCQQMTIGGVAQHPEQHLVNRMAAWGAQTHDVLSFETTPNDGAGTITPMHVVQSGGKTYSPISISRDWRDDVMKIKYIEMLPTT